MSTLKEFEGISGLRINKEKTKVIKIGGWRDSRLELCKDLKLDLTTEFISLGISYRVNELNNIIEYNINNKIKEIKKLIYVWNA